MGRSSYNSTDWTNETRRVCCYSENAYGQKDIEGFQWSYQTDAIHRSLPYPEVETRKTLSLESSKNRKWIHEQNRKSKMEVISKAECLEYKGGGKMKWIILYYQKKYVRLTLGSWHPFTRVENSWLESHLICRVFSDPCNIRSVNSPNSVKPKASLMIRNSKIFFHHLDGFRLRVSRDYSDYREATSEYGCLRSFIIESYWKIVGFEPPKYRRRRHLGFWKDHHWSTFNIHIRTKNHYFVSHFSL